MTDSRKVEQATPLTDDELFQWATCSADGDGHDMCANKNTIARFCKMVRSLQQRLTAAEAKIAGEPVRNCHVCGITNISAFNIEQCMQSTCPMYLGAPEPGVEAILPTAREHLIAEKKVVRDWLGTLPDNPDKAAIFECWTLTINELAHLYAMEASTQAGERRTAEGHQKLSDACHSFLINIVSVHPGLSQEEGETRTWTRFREAVGRYALETVAQQVRTPAPSVEQEGSGVAK